MCLSGIFIFIFSGDHDTHGILHVTSTRVLNAHGGAGVRLGWDELDELCADGRGSEFEGESTKRHRAGSSSTSAAASGADAHPPG